MQSKIYNKATLLLLMLLTMSVAAFSQAYTPETILQHIDAKFSISTGSMQVCSMYVIDEVPYEGAALEQELATHTQASIGYVELVEATGVYANTSCQWLVRIFTKDGQPETEKEALLLQAKAYYKVNVPKLAAGEIKCRLCKAFKLENKLYSPAEVKTALAGLSANDISFIAWYSQPVNPSLFGAGSQNGLIEIFLKQPPVERANK